MPTRRELVAGAAGLGALGVGAASQVRVGGYTASPPPTDAWPLERYDVANRGANPTASPPTDPAVAWSRHPVETDSSPERLEPSLSLVAGRAAVYVTGDGVASLSRTDGSVRWRRSLPGEAPALWDGTLYVGREPSDGVEPRLVALDADGGSDRWTAPLRSAGRHRIVADGTVLTCGPHTVTAVGTDGRRRWQRSTGSIEGGVAVHDGALYVAAAHIRRYRRPTLLDRVLGGPGGTAWETEYVGHATAPVVFGETVLAVNQIYGGGDGAAVAVTTVDGSDRWTALPFPEDDPEYVRHGAPAVVGEVVVLPVTVVRTESNDTRVVALSQSDGTVVWEQSGLGGRLVAGAGDVVLVGTGREDGSGGVVALDATSGERRWAVPLGAPVTALTPVDGTVFAATVDGRVAAVR